MLPGRGFLLNNELTDFSAVYDPADPNRIEPRKRPRSSMSPTIVLQGKKPLLAVGSPGGSTIITTVLGILVNRLDLGMSLEQAIAAPRAAPNNTTPVKAEQAYLDLYGAALTAARPRAHAGRRCRARPPPRSAPPPRSSSARAAGSPRPPNPPAAVGERRRWSSAR